MLSDLYVTVSYFFGGTLKPIFGFTGYILILDFMTKDVCIQTLKNVHLSALIILQQRKVHSQREKLSQIDNGDLREGKEKPKWGIENFLKEAKHSTPYKTSIEKQNLSFFMQKICLDKYDQQRGVFLVRIYYEDVSLV